MKIIVLNGSPKGDVSITMQYVHFIQKKFSRHALKILNISQRIGEIEKQEGAFDNIIKEIRSAHAVLWAFPVYFLLVPHGYKRFIELIHERGAEEAFRDRCAACLSTSIHFFDHIAHHYIQAISEDLEMRYVGGFSAGMYDLLEARERTRLALFAGHFFESVQNGLVPPRRFAPLRPGSFAYVPRKGHGRVPVGGRKVVVLTDSADERTNLGRMVERFAGAFSGAIEVVNIHEVAIRGGCLGCLQCGYDNRCRYGDKDGYAGFFESTVRKADVLVLAGNITDRYLSSRWKLFFDRSFFNNHLPVMKNKQLGFIISGPLGQSADLRQALEGFFEVQQAGIVDFVTDECGDSARIDALLDGLAARLLRCADTGYVRPAAFPGVAGRKVIRDNVFGLLRFPFRADHRFFKSNGLYDFPHRDYRVRIRNALLLLLSRIPPVRKDIYANRMKTEMIKPLQRILEKEHPGNPRESDGG
jgi:multimeric flavodoxin WrbA